MPIAVSVIDQSSTGSVDLGNAKNNLTLAFCGLGRLTLRPRQAMEAGNVDSGWPNCTGCKSRPVWMQHLSAQDGQQSVLELHRQTFLMATARAPEAISRLSHYRSRSA